MKLKIVGFVLAIVLLSTPQFAGASTVFETTGFIIGTEGVTFDFEADTAPFTYRATLSDLSEAPIFGFDYLYLSLTTSTDTVDSITGPGNFTFEATPGKTYFANIFGIGGGDVDAGLFGIEITAVPVPPALLLLGSGLFALFALRKRN